MDLDTIRAVSAVPRQQKGHIVTTHTTTPPPPADPPRRQSFVLWISIALLVALILGVLASYNAGKGDGLRVQRSSAQNPRDGGATATASPTTAPTSTLRVKDAPAVVPAAGLNPDCPKQPRPVLPTNWLGQTLHAPATDQPVYDALAPLRAAGVNVIAYMGEAVEVGAASDLVGAVWCNDMTSFYGLDSTFNKVGYDGTKSFIKGLVAKRPGAVKYWIVGQNSNGKTTLGAQIAKTNARVAAIRSLHTGIKVLVLTDRFSATDLKKFHADSHGVVFLPYQGSRDYGSDALLPGIAKTVNQVDSSENRIRISQDLCWRNVDPAFAKQWGFAKCEGDKPQTIQPDDVASLAKKQTDVSLEPVLLVSQEDVVNKPPTEEDDVTGFLVPNVQAVKAAIPGLGGS